MCMKCEGKQVIIRPIQFGTATVPCPDCNKQAYERFFARLEGDDCGGGLNLPPDRS